MTDLKKAAQQALEALLAAWQHNPHWQTNESITALKSALEQPEQEPRNVEEIAADFGREFAQTFSGKRTEPQPEQADAEAALRFALAQRDWAFKQLQAQPDRREWRGLKEWEINDGRDQLPTEDLCNWSFRQGVYFAEKALKERNA